MDAASVNPFASPLAEDSYRPDVDSGIEATRRKLLRREASIKSAGLIVLFFSALATVLGGFALLGVAISVSYLGVTDDTVAVLVFSTIVLTIAALQYWIGAGLRQLRPSARIPSIIYATICLFGVPIGTLFGLHLLLNVCGKKGEQVMSPEYQETIAATPHIRYRTSLIVLMLIAILLGMVLYSAVVTAFPVA